MRILSGKRGPMRFGEIRVEEWCFCIFGKTVDGED